MEMLSWPLSSQVLSNDWMPMICLPGRGSWLLLSHKLYISGACWAGTIVWQAAIDLCDYISREHSYAMARGATVVELGCGM
jgi:uncharacterized RDD family membrane protein YckC